MSSPGVEALTGGIGSLIALCATYPLKTAYTLKAIRLQEAAAGRPLTPQERASLLSDPRRLAATLLRPLGLLYSGLKPAAVETVASQAIYFYFYSLLRAAVVSHNRRRRGLPPVTPGSVAARREDIGVPASLGVAAVAGVVNMVLTSPAQVLGTQMQAASTLKRQLEARGQASASIRSDTAGVAASLWREGGPAAFWKGLGPNLLLVCNPALQYMAYEWLTQRASEVKRRRAGASKRVALGSGEVFLLGAAAKIVATLVTYPIIVIKSRLQAQSSHMAPDLRYKGTLDTIRRIADEEGLRGFFSGLESKILQTALNAALMLMIKEKVHSSAAALMHALEGGNSARAAAARRIPVQVVTVRAIVR